MSRLGTIAARFGGALERMAPQARGRLFRKYAIPLVALVGGALTVNSLIEAYYSYHENRRGLVALQREKAQGAAAVIEQFVKEIEGQLGWTTHASIVQGGAGTEQRRFEFLRLLRQAPAITEVAWIDAQGREQIRVSRLAMDVIGSGADFSQDQRFLEAKANKRFVSPVYFRKESEPYLTLALTGTSRGSGVAVAEVNLKFIWDVVSRIRVGKAGAAYVLDERGFLIAHPDIGLVLRKTDLSGLDHVATALAGLKQQPSTADVQPIGHDRAGEDVLAASAPIPALRWLVFVEQPLAEAYRPIYESLWRSGFVLAIGLAVAALAGLWLAKRMVVPIRALADGAARIGGGDLDYRIDVSTGDEVQALADGFNEMGARLKDSYATLEHKVELRTRELSEALAHQTATSEVLGVISRSPSVVEPVFDAIVHTAARLCGADHASIYRLRDGTYHFEAGDRTNEEFTAYCKSHPLPPGRGSLVGRTAAMRRTVHLPDALADLEYATLELQRIGAYRSMLGVPLLREGEPVGVIALVRTKVAPFTDRQIELVTTFADQAVIAIENARLFEEVQARTRELQESLEYQTATSEVLGVISRSPTELQPVLQSIVTTAAGLCDGFDATILLKQGQQLRVGAHHGSIPLDFETKAIGRGWITGRAVVDRLPVHVHDLGAARDDFPEGFDLHVRHGHRTGLAIPLLRKGKAIGAFMIRRMEVCPFTEQQIEVLQTFADQAVIAINNVRLFEEIEEKSRQLEIASQHKSQFLANMSHELRTPLNAILGYTELIQDGVYGEPNEKTKGVLDRVQANGKHLLGLINDVLDLSKIEAGQLTLRIDSYSMSSVVQTVVAATESLAAEKRLPIKTEIDVQLPAGFGDERRLCQVLLNLVGNAIKFTDAGEVRVAASSRNGHFCLDVSDTGPGIARSEQQRIFEEFHQVDSSNTKRKGGSGLGLAISKRIVEMHGGRIWVDSDIGRGSTFHVEVPIQAEQEVGAA